MAISAEKQEQLHRERRKLIIDTAYYLFFSKGYKNTSVQDIAQEAGISKGLVYRYFKNKEELLLARREETFSCLSSFTTDPSPKHALYEYLKLSFRVPKPGDYVGQIYVLFEAILEGDICNETFNRDMVHGYGKYFFGPIFRRGQELGEIRDGDPESMADLYWHLILGYCFNREPADRVDASDRMPDEIMHLFLASNV